MLTLPLYNMQAEKIGEEKINPSVFSIEINPGVIHRYIEIYLGNIRKNIASTKNRSDVRGGGKKPWKQKGTGRARAGSIRSPLWKGGGVTFGPNSEKNYLRKLNKKEKKKAFLMAISSKFKDKKIILIDNIDLKEQKTKEAALFLKNFKIDKRILLVLKKKDEKLIKSFRNIQNLDIATVDNLNTYIVVKNEYLFLSKDSFDFLNKASIEK